MSDRLNFFTINVLLLSAILVSPALLAANYFDDAQALIDAGKVNEAEVLMMQGLQENPQDKELRLQLGLFYLSQGLPKGAEQELQHALQDGIPQQVVFPHLARAYLMRGKYQRVIDEIPILPNISRELKAQLLSLHGQAYMGLSKFNQAKSRIRSARLLDTGLDSVEIVTARFELFEKDYDKAGQRMRQVLADTPNCIDCLEILGDAEQANGNLETAQRTYTNLLKLDPDNFSGLIGSVGVALKKRDIELAQTRLNKAEASHENNPLIAYFKAAIAFEKDDNKTAHTYLKVVLDKMPEHLPSRLLSGLLAKQENQPDLARNQIRRVLSSNPDNLTARKALASIELEQGDYRQVVRLLAPLLETNEKGEVAADASTKALLASAYMQLNQADKAEVLLDAAASQDPAFKIQRATGYLAKGELEEGITQLQVLEHKSSKSMYLLSVAYIQQQQFDQALATISDLITGQPDNPVFYNLAGTAHLGRNDLSAARTAFKKAISLDSMFTLASLNLARLDLQEHKPEQARKSLLGALKSKPEHEAVLMQLALVEAADNNASLALEYLRKITDQNHNAIKAGLIIVENLLSRGQLDAALKTAIDLHNSNPQVIAVTRVLGRAQLANNNFSHAQVLFKEILETTSGSVSDYFYLAEAYAGGHKNKLANAGFREVQKRQPNHLLTGIKLATYEALHGEPSKALKMLKRLSRRHLRSPEIPELMGDIHAQNKTKQGNRARAHQAYLRAVRLKPNAQRLIKAYITRPEEPLTDLDLKPIKSWVQQHPKDIDTRLFLAGELEKVQPEQAGLQYEQILKQNPSNIPALNNLSMRSIGKDNTIALAYGELAWQIAPEDGVVLDTYAQALIANKEFKKAVPLLKDATNRLRNEPVIRYHLAQALEGAQQPKKAREQLRRLLLTYPSFKLKKDANEMLLRLMKDR